ncbi:RNA-binding KH domain-containing protein PEPPER isoform X1 [Sorghum bicolor]|uniref:RNA-binding KH domain-containing protein PEPPER isoform X1 n=1 Tax=Sorghum bicolor TaxID=4558 RepID=UPI000B42587F|nr:RNA-binding KH domain-containing protein PEPPER isoform X1 [Sorghum bicolor]|eukprot:XP_021314432.1 RNA-binding KH domain-containing protein PEPPER isoform X1 [Sorghum bicolor]
MEPPSPPRPCEEEEEEEAEIDFDEEEEDPEEVEPWFTSSSDSEAEREPKRPAALEPPPPPIPFPAPAWAVPPEQQPAPITAVEAEKKGDGDSDARPRWPGTNVFRLVVPTDKVGGVIGRRGETIKRLCDETRARIRVLDAPLGAACRIVLVSAKEEVEAEMSPAMNAAIKIFKHINEIEEINSDGTLSASASDICSVRLLVPFEQAVHLIGKQGVTIKSIEESTGTTVRIRDEDELLSHETVDERIVEIRGASLKVLNALKSVLELLRKFLVDHGVLHLFERKNQEVVQPQDASNYPLAVNQDFLLSDQRSHGDPISSRLLYGHDPSFCGPHHATDSLMIQQSRANPKGSRFLYGRDPSFHDPYSRDLSQPTDSLITKITRTMQVPLAYAEDVIGVRGENIEYIRSVSGAVVALEEIGDYQEVQVMIEGTPSQVQTAHQLVQEVISGDRAPPSRSSYYNSEGADPGLLNSPHVGSRFLHSPRAIATSREYLPWQYEEQTPHGHWRNPTHYDYRGYRP